MPITPLLSSVAGLSPSLGAILIGGIICAFLSGIVTMQAILYCRIYPEDPTKFKAMVGFVWTIDLLHTAMASAANWTYFIGYFGDEDVIDYITWTIAVTVALTAFQTWFVHCFFAWRIFTLSRSNYFLVIPIVSYFPPHLSTYPERYWQAVLALFRLGTPLKLLVEVDNNTITFCVSGRLGINIENVSLLIRGLLELSVPD
ncbi:hypothetical protein QCA50_010080 [Cerrena zonata]|uniref:Uncharacterized protein n=1 Tax=Cerrena zonata TaxID=2478898 RepID=A0AAW0FY96_9APHY